MFGRLGWMELVLILVLALIIFGPGKLPDVARAVGKSIGEFRKATKDSTRELEQAAKEVEEDVKDSDSIKGSD